MLKRQTFVWFVRGFVITIAAGLAITLLAAPRLSWAQGGDLNLFGLSAPSESVVAPGTDDPAGLAPAAAPPPTHGGPGSNAAALVQGDPPVEPGTDILAPTGDYNSPLTIAAAQFIHDGFAPTSYWFSFADGYIRGANNLQNACMEAPVYLPNGAVLDSFYAYLLDNDASLNVTVNLRRVRTLTGVGEVLGDVSTSGQPNTIQYLGDTTISPNNVSDLYAYYITTCLNSDNIRLYGVRIFYHMP